MRIRIKDVRKWLWTYKAWTWPPIIITLSLLTWALFGEGATSYVFALILGAVYIQVYRTINKTVPELWVMVLILGLPVLLWGLWVIKPEWYLEWRHSRFFWWMIVSIVLLSWLASYKISPVASALRKGIAVLLIIVVGIGIWEKWAEYRNRPKDIHLSAARTIAPNTQDQREAPRGYTKTESLIQAPVDKCSLDILAPLDGKVRWSAENRSHKFTVISNSGSSADFPLADGKYLQLPDGGSVCFQSGETEPVMIRVAVYDPI